MEMVGFVGEKLGMSIYKIIEKKLCMELLFVGVCLGFRKVQNNIHVITYTTWKGSMAQLPFVLVYHGPDS